MCLPFFFLFCFCYHLQRLLSPGFNREKTHGHKCCQNQSTRCVDRSIWVGTSAVDGHKRRAQSRNAVKAAGDASGCTTVRSREDLGSVGVQDAIHDVLEESLQAGAKQLDVGVGRSREAEEQHSGNQCGDNHGTLTTNILDFNGVAGQDRSRDTDDRSDSIVPVGNVCRAGAGATCILEVLGKEGIEQGITHSNRSPAEPEENGLKGD